jgi:long-chain acyl-CoA synthetase
MNVLQYRYSSFYEMLSAHATRKPRKKVIFVGDRKISYRALLEETDIFAGYLDEAGVGPDDRVALFMRNSAEFVIAVFAISKVGGIVVPVNTFLKSEELSYILEDSGASVLIASDIYEKTVDGSDAGKLCRHIVWEGSLKKTEKGRTFRRSLMVIFRLQR